MTPEQRTLVGQHVRKRRLSLGLSVSQAASDAPMSRPTWIAIEQGTRATEDHNYGRVEAVLQWPPGTIDRLAVGEEPPSGDASQQPAAATNAWSAKLISIRDNPRRSPHLRAMAAAQLAQLEAILDAARAEEASDQAG